MSGAVGPGDWVECIRDIGDLKQYVAKWEGRPPQIGDVLCVLEVWPIEWHGGKVYGGLQFTRPRGILHDGRECGFDPDYFKPIGYDPTGVIEGLKQPVKVDA